VSLANRRFHRALYSRCDNELITRELEQMQDLPEPAPSHGAARAAAGDHTLVNIAGTGHKSLEESQRVHFETSQGQKGPQANNVRPI
jgi:DNA-binding GntR family transcriptional regulator